ncbi:L-aspartate oxidase [Granulicoccus sp. GXG6511]|uniref:L-aspartate oxidase n=1 Tax=Granulicoccus sp. GXG6511 TaxID=3381351 RepID=UPI003D7D85BF
MNNPESGARRPPAAPAADSRPAPGLPSPGTRGRAIGRELATPPVAWTDTAQVVVVGSGAAGLATTVELATAGIDTLVVTRGEITETATDWAQGGLAAVWSDEDSLALHVSDTLTAGAGLCDVDAVWDLVTNAPEAIEELITLGAQFDTDATGAYDLHLEGGHHARRILHAGGDATGREVQRTLSAALHAAILNPESSIRVRAHTRLIDVLTDADGAACGVRVIDADGRIGEIASPAVVLAAGGIGQLWSLTTNPSVATGDGIAAALRAGATIRDIEFVQFHPTILVVPEAHRRPGDRGVLISEAVRGEGAFLIDRTGARVMQGLHPLADLAPRDVVASSMEAHMARTGEPNLFLDATHFGADKWESHFPSILGMCRERGVDPVTEPIPVRPAAHYLCGGVSADLQGTTEVPGLYAVGEVAATGVQGANRLASNSVTEGLVAGERLGALLVGDRFGWTPAETVRRAAAPVTDPAALVDLRRATDEGVSVHRTDAGLRAALRTLAELPATDDFCHESLDAENLRTVGTLVATSALARTESRGCHRRADHPQQVPAWVRRLALRLNGGLRIRQEPINAEEDPE